MIAVGYGTGESRQKEELRVGQEAQEVETDPLLPTFGGHPPPTGRPGGQLPPSWYLGLLFIWMDTIQPPEQPLSFVFLSRWCQRAMCYDFPPFSHWNSSRPQNCQTPAGYFGVLRVNGPSEWVPWTSGCPATPPLWPWRQRPLTVGMCSGWCWVMYLWWKKWSWYTARS